MGISSILIILIFDYYLFDFILIYVNIKIWNGTFPNLLHKTNICEIKGVLFYFISKILILKTNFQKKYIKIKRK